MARLFTDTHHLPRFSARASALSSLFSHNTLCCYMCVTLLRRVPLSALHPMPGLAQPIQPIHILGWARRVPRTSCAVSKPHRSNCELYSIMLHPAHVQFRTFTRATVSSTQSHTLSCSIQLKSCHCAVSYLHHSNCELYSIQLIHILGPALGILLAHEAPEFLAQPLHGSVLRQQLPRSLCRLFPK